jgi:2-methylisocitrate lyase-like PEP mutase family enzyme
MAERARMTVRALGDVPLLADADTGYGAPINVIRTVREYEDAGVAAIQLEDQAFPKKCGHLPDKELISADDFARTLRAALEARTDPGMLVIARTDARGPLGLDEAIARANRYAAEGADILFVEAPQSTAEIERIAAEVKAPLLLNLVIGGLTPEQSAERLQQLGFAIAIHPSAVLAHSTLGALSALCRLRGIKADDFLPSKPEEFFDLVGMAEWSELGEKYQPARQGQGA